MGGSHQGQVCHRVRWDELSRRLGDREEPRGPLQMHLRAMTLRKPLCGTRTTTRRSSLVRRTSTATELAKYDREVRHEVGIPHLTNSPQLPFSAHINIPHISRSKTKS